VNGGLRFEWDIHNIGHLARHNVRPEEAEQALSGEIVDLDYSVTRDGQERWTAMGQTTAGRILVIVWTVLDDGVYRPITAYPAIKALEVIYYRVIQGA
jgi:uncharacterized DUF497 family protein